MISWKSKCLLKKENLSALSYPPHLLIPFLLFSCIREMADYGINPLLTTGFTQISE